MSVAEPETGTTGSPNGLPWSALAVDSEYVQLAIIPMFLFSATFFPVTAFDGWLRWVVEVTPLTRGVVLCRELTTGILSWDSVASVAYLALMGVAGLTIASRRLHTLLRA